MLSASRVYQRYVAIGDSTTEGLDDPDGRGGYRGWANRFAEIIAAKQGHLLYANLAVRGLRTREILERQLDRALSMKPDLSTVVAGTNDVLRPKFSVDAYGRDIRHMQRSLIQQGATVLTFTLPDMSRVNPITRRVAPRVKAMNAMLRIVSAETGAILVDMANHEVGSDPRLWSRDRLHANSVGHARIAAALANAIQLPGSDMSWANPLEPDSPRAKVARLIDDAKWSREFLLPWIGRRLRGKSTSLKVLCKRPELTPVRQDDVRASATAD